MVVRLPAHYKQEGEAQVVAFANGKEDSLTYRSVVDL